MTFAGSSGRPCRPPTHAPSAGPTRYPPEAGGRRVAVGYDGRLSSPELEAALVDGLTRGHRCRAVGLGPTPMLYYAAATLGVDGGIMVTGSHNPADHNGFKLVFQGKSFYGAAIQSSARPRGASEPERRARKGRRARDPRGLCRATGARLSRRPAADRRLGPRKRRHRRRRPTTHRASARQARPAERDDRRHLSRPSSGSDDPENLVQLQEAVARERCDLGIAFDGDGDRIGVVDSQGRILWGDQLMVVLARDVLSRHPGAPILADVKASQVLFDEIARPGGRPVMAATGHSLIKAKLAEMGAPLAGEMSGHIFFADGYYGFDDAVYVAVRLLAILSAPGSVSPICATGCLRSSTRRNCAFRARRAANSKSCARSANACVGPGPR